MSKPEWCSNNYRALSALIRVAFKSHLDVKAFEQHLLVLNEYVIVATLSATSAQSKINVYVCVCLEHYKMLMRNNKF